MIDWKKIEGDYRAGLLSLRQIAGEAGITEGAIRKRARRDGWHRDLGPAIIQRSDAELVLLTAAKEDRERQSERQIIEANADVVTLVRMAHRKDLANLKTIVNELVTQLKTDKESASLGERTRIAKDLTATLGLLIDKERTAYGIDKMASEANVQKGITVTFCDANQAA